MWNIYGFNNFNLQHCNYGGSCKGVSIKTVMQNTNKGTFSNFFSCKKDYVVNTWGEIVFL